MGRAGRKRKTTALRYSSGQTRHEEEPRRTAVWPRVRELAEKHAIDPRLGTPLGRLFYFREISAPMFDAGTRFAELEARYLTAIGAKQPNVPAQALSLPRGGKASDPDHPQYQKWCERQRQDHSRIRGALGATIDVMIRICVQNLEPTPYDKSILLVGLDILAHHWKLKGIHKGK